MRLRWHPLYEINIPTVPLARGVRCLQLLAEQPPEGPPAGQAARARRLRARARAAPRAAGRRPLVVRPLVVPPAPRASRRPRGGRPRASRRPPAVPPAATQQCAG